MVIPAFVTFRRVRLARIAASWWLLSVVFSWLLVQPFSGFLAAQSATVGVKALDPFVLFVTLQREQQALSTALAAGIGLLLASKLCAQVPFTSALVQLSDKPSEHSPRMRTLRALPQIAMFSLLAEGMPIAVLYVTWRVTHGPGWLLSVGAPALVVILVLAFMALGVWLVCLTLLDLARIAVVAAPRLQAAGTSARDGASVFWCAPLRLLMHSTLSRMASFACVTTSLACGLWIANSQTVLATFAAWLVTQAGVLLGLFCRTLWLAAATEHAQSLRPPSRNS